MLKLGTQTGSFINHAMSMAGQPEQPEVGMGATELMWTDRHAYTVTRVVSPRRVEVRQDLAIRVDENGMSDAQQYRYEPDPEAPVEVITKRKNGRWVRMGQPTSHGPVFILGTRDEHHDYSF